MTSKAQLRHQVRALVKTMSREERERQSAAVFQKLMLVERFLVAERVALYVSVEHEVSTKAIFEFCFAHNKRVFIPHFARHSPMHFLEVYSEEDLKSALVKKDFGIQQLVCGEGRPEALSSGGLDVVVVPGVAFDAKCRRLGNGFGFYDKYIEKCFERKCRPLLVGLAFTQQICDSIPTEAHDIPLHLVLRQSLMKKCENLGCQRMYREDDNDGLNDVCVYHAGQPFFHDAYKGWSCCQQKSTDFTTFLNYPGCSRGKHSDVKPIKQEVKEEESQHEPKEEEAPAPLPPEPDASVWTEVRMSEAKGVSEAVVPCEERLVFCKNCRRSEVSREECVYHSGQVIFHDSLKYWTCCAHKKFTDFDDFHALEGCQRAPNHEMAVRVKSPREDWFQTADHVHLVLYGLRGVRALRSSVATNGRSVRASLRDESGLELFVLERRLKELISGSESRVLVSSAKVELVLGKWSRGKQWSDLFE